MTDLLAQIADSLTPTGLMASMNALLAGAVGVMWRRSEKRFDACEQDRRSLWSKVAELEDRLNS